MTLYAQELLLLHYKNKANTFYKQVGNDIK